MTSEQRRAHERMLSTLPVRTHERVFLDVGTGRNIKAEAEFELARKMNAEGARRDDIARATGLPRRVLYRRLGAERPRKPNGGA